VGREGKQNAASKRVIADTKDPINEQIDRGKTFIAGYLLQARFNEVLLATRDYYGCLLFKKLREGFKLSR
jgi:hypothetical protein